MSGGFRDAGDAGGIELDGDGQCAGAEAEVAVGDGEADGPAGDAVDEGGEKLAA